MANDTDQMAGLPHQMKEFASFRCDHCGAKNTKRAPDVRKALNKNAGLYCDRTCSGLGRRVQRSESESRRLKSEYDARRRVELADTIKRDKAEYHKRTYNPEKARTERAKHMDRHVTYCRGYMKDPVKKAAKVAYDRDRLAKMKYGDLSDAMPILRELESLIRSRYTTPYERRKARGYYENQQNRRTAHV